MFKTLQCNLSFGHFMTSFLGSVRVQTLENCDRFVKYYSNYYSTSVPLKVPFLSYCRFNSTTSDDALNKLPCYQ